MNPKQVKVFFFGAIRIEEGEGDINTFLAKEDIVIENILQSGASCSIGIDTPDILTMGAIITIVYRKK